MCERMKKILIVTLCVGMLGFAAEAKSRKAKAKAKAADAKAAAVDTKAKADKAANDADIENKLLKLTTLEDAFIKAWRTRNLLIRYIAQETAKLKDATDDATKKELRKNIGAARKRLQTLRVAMDIVFGIGNRRQYEYDSVKSTIYLRVGTVT